ncbi:MAG: chaperone modulator CbpM [Gammaproteobacteria bacterium]|nr:chaperone modulator CbpM [Gammaproteobacteria bacterium]
MKIQILSGMVLDEQTELSLGDLCRACSQHEDWVRELVAEGVLDPIGGDHRQWRFPAEALQRAHIAMRLQRDLDINLPGVALVLDLLEELDQARARLHRIEPG